MNMSNTLRKGTEIGQLLYVLLKDIVGIGGRVYPSIAEREQERPFIVYTRESVTPVYTHDGIEEDIVTATIDIVSAEYTQAIEITGIVRNILDEFRNDGEEGAGTAGVVVTSTYLKDATEEYADDVGFIQRLKYRFTVKLKN
jgi:hypothetical protein